MSLSIANEGLAYNATKVANTTAALGAITLATFDEGVDGGSASILNLYLDNSGATPSANIGADLPAPSALGVVSGTELNVYNDTTGKRVNFTDAKLSVGYTFVNKNGEFITLVADDAADRWLIK
jgi:hypothetical protein